MAPDRQAKAKMVFVSNQQGKRVCGYKLVGYKTITKGKETIKREIREPVFEGEGKFKGVKLPTQFLREFMMNEEKVPEDLVKVPSSVVG